MRGQENPQASMFSYVSLEQRVPKDHPLRTLRALVGGILANMSTLFDERYSHTGRPSIPPEQLLRALLVQILFTIRSERQLIEQLDYNLLFRWFVGLGMNDAVWDRTVFSIKDGSGPDKPAGRNPETDFKGNKRSNATHQSTTDPQARLYKKGEFAEAKLCYMTHALSENRNGLVVDVESTQATGRAEWEAAIRMIDRSVRKPGATVGADKSYDTAEFVAALERRGIKAHVARKVSGSAVDGRTAHGKGYAMSLRRRKMIEEAFG